MSLRTTEAGTDAATPWWRVPFVWMVIGGPLAVVVAGFATLAIAIAYPDPVIVAPSTGKGAEMTCPSPDARITPGCPGLWNDAQQQAWARIVDFIHLCATSGAK